MRFDHEELFKELAKSYGINLFLGAGFSVYAYNNNDESLPLGDDINQRLKGRIREALIKMILGFDIEDMDLEPEE